MPSQISGLRKRIDRPSIVHDRPADAKAPSLRIKLKTGERGIGEAERAARFRELRALATVYVGPRLPLTVALRSAALDVAPASLALDELGAIPPLTRRRLLSTYGALPGALARRRGGDPNLRSTARPRRNQSFGSSAGSVRRMM